MLSESIGQWAERTKRLSEVRSYLESMEQKGSSTLAISQLGGKGR